VAGRKVPDNLLEDDMPTDLPDLIDIATLAERLGDSERHIRRLVGERRIPFLKLGRFVRFDAAEIVRWLDDGRKPVKHDCVNAARHYDRP
jgi:excisionase family DNA binding protein